MRIRWGRAKKFLSALLAGAAVWVAMIPTDADPRLVAAGNLVIALSVLLGPANDPPTRQEVAVQLPPTRAARPNERPRNVSNPKRDSRVGGYESGSRPASEMPPPSTGIKKPPTNFS